MRKTRWVMKGLFLLAPPIAIRQRRSFTTSWASTETRTKKETNSSVNKEEPSESHFPETLVKYFSCKIPREYRIISEELLFCKARSTRETRDKALFELSVRGMKWTEKMKQKWISDRRGWKGRENWWKIFSFFWLNGHRKIMFGTLESILSASLLLARFVVPFSCFFFLFLFLLRILLSWFCFSSSLLGSPRFASLLSCCFSSRIASCQSLRTRWPKQWLHAHCRVIHRNHKGWARIERASQRFRRREVLCSESDGKPKGKWRGLKESEANRGLVARFKTKNDEYSSSASFVSLCFLFFRDHVPFFFSSSSSCCCCLFVCFVLFCFVLFCFVLFCFVLFCFVFDKRLNNVYTEDHFFFFFSDSSCCLLAGSFRHAKATTATRSLSHSSSSPFLLFSLSSSPTSCL